MPAPAPFSKITSWRWETSSRTDVGVSPTRYSWVLISFGTPMITGTSQEALGAVRRRIDEGPLAADELGDEASRHRAEREAVVGMAEGEPELLVPRRAPDNRHHVRRAGPRPHPRIRIEPLGKREELARDGLGAV